MAETAAAAAATPMETSSNSNSSGGAPHPSSAAKTKVDFAEVQETMSRLAAHKGVTSVLILNHAGDILTQTGQGMVGNPKLLKQTLDVASSYVRSIPNDHQEEEEEDEEEEGVMMEGVVEGNVHELDTNKDAIKKKKGKGRDPLENLSFVRIRSKTEEILVAPKNHYVLVVLQDPTIAPL